MDMNDISQVITEIVNHQTLPYALILAALAFVALLNFKRIRLGWLNFKTRYCLNHLGLEQVSNITCPDGLGHDFTIDRLILRHDGISLLVFKQYPGKIFCADHIDNWTQMLGQKSYSFNNPLFELDYQLKAISSCIPGVPVNGFLFFDHLAEFPKGHPQRVIHPNSIPVSLKRNTLPPVEIPVMEAWEKFKAMTKH